MFIYLLPGFAHTKGQKGKVEEQHLQFVVVCVRVRQAAYSKGFYLKNGKMCVRGLNNKGTCVVGVAEGLLFHEYTRERS